MRLFWAESVAGVINWSLAAPLFSINYVLLDAALQRSLRPIKNLVSPQGVEGLVEQGVRVLRWGLWMAPIINSFLRQSPDPSWYNQDGAVRTLVAIGAERDPEPGRLPPVQPAPVPRPARLRLAAHPDLVRPYGPQGREPRQSVVSRRRPRGRSRGPVRRPQGPHPRHPRRNPPVRHLGAPADPVLHSARRGVGQGVDRGRDACARRRADARAGADARLRLCGRHRRLRRGRGRGGRARPPTKSGAPAPWLAGAPLELARRPEKYVLNNGAVGVELHARRARRRFRDGRRARRRPDRLHPPPARPAAGARPFLLPQRGRRGAVVDRLRAGAARRRISDRGAGLQSSGDRPHAERRRGAHGDRARRGADRGAQLADPHFRQVRQAAPAAADQLLRDRRPRNGGLRPRPRFRRHACRDGVRPRAQRDLRPQPAAALGARRPRRDVVLRRQPGRGRGTRRLRGFAHALPRRGIAHRGRPVASAGAGGSWTTKASSGRSTRPPASRSN